MENTGFILFKDKTVVVLYTIYLAQRTSQDVEGIYDYSVNIVHDSAPFRRWIGTEDLNRKTFEGPCCIVSYNLFMNSVDRFE